MFSMLCDFLDGKLARILNSVTPYGTMFDTLSDFVAFGIVPAFLVYQISLNRIPYIGVIVAVFFVFSGCYRLIRFTLRKKDNNNKSSFIGLPIPIAAGFIAASALVSLNTWNQIPDHNVFLIIVFALGVLMSSKIEYLAFEPDSLQRTDIKLLILIFLASLILTLKHSYIVILFWITAYILFCLIRHITLIIRNRNIEINLNSKNDKKKIQDNQI
jgi:CDP-diacylglycerol--serine O-phosphatidyltransferase